MATPESEKRSNGLLPERSGPKAPGLGTEVKKKPKGESKTILVIVTVVAGLLVGGLVLMAILIAVLGSSDSFDGGVGAIGDVILDQQTCLFDGGSGTVTMFVDNTAEVPSDYLIKVTFTAESGQVSTHQSKLLDVQPKNRATVTVTSDGPVSGGELSCQVTSASRRPSQ